MRARSRTIARSIANSHAMYQPDRRPRMKSWRPTALTSISGQEAGCMKSVTYRPAGRWWNASSRFLRHLLSLGLSRKTLRQHRDNLWLLAASLIRDLHDAPRLRKRPMDQVVLAALDREGGPLISHGTSEISNAPSTPHAKVSIASSPTAAVHRQSGCGHVDNAEEAFPTCPQPQQMQMPSTERYRPGSSRALYFNTSHHSHPPSATHRFPRGGDKGGHGSRRPHCEPNMSSCSGSLRDP